MTPVTLDDLKQAIEAVPDEPEFDRQGYMDPPDDVIAAFRLERAEHEEARADAWRTAFEWLETNDSGPGWKLTVEYLEGMRLIRERLE